MEITSEKDRQIIRELGKKYRDICASDRNGAARKLWRDHNSLMDTRPPVQVCSYWHTAPEVDPFIGEIQTTGLLRSAEIDLRRRIWQYENIMDDSIQYPWLTVPAEMERLDSFWGFQLNIQRDPVSTGYRAFPVLRTMEDLKKLRATPHKVLNRNPEQAQVLRDVLDGVLDVHVSTSTVYPRWGGTDLSEAVGKLVGLQEFMYMMYDEPEILHGLLSFMRDAVLANIDECERQGDWSTADGWSYNFNDCHEFPAPSANHYGVKMKDLWFFTHSQEYECVGPAQHEEFLLQYQMPIMERFGLVSYGCCDTLDNKIDMLRKIPNLRTICVGPRGNVGRCAEQAEKQYLLSWRPNPAMVGMGYDLENCRRIVREGFRQGKNAHVHLMLKEMMTIERDPQRLRDFARMSREESLNLE